MLRNSSAMRAGCRQLVVVRWCRAVFEKCDYSFRNRGAMRGRLAIDRIIDLVAELDSDRLHGALAVRLSSLLVAARYPTRAILQEEADARD